MTLIELLFTLALMGTLTAWAVPIVRDAMDELRTSMAARYLSARVISARIEAVKRSASVGLRFDAAGDDYRYASLGDGNANGVRSADAKSPELKLSKLLRDRRLASIVVAASGAEVKGGAMISVHNATLCRPAPRPGTRSG